MRTERDGSFARYSDNVTVIPIRYFSMDHEEPICLKSGCKYNYLTTSCVIGKVTSLNDCQVYKRSSYSFLHYVQFAVSSPVYFFIHHSCQCPLEISSNYDYSMAAGWQEFRQILIILSFHPYAFCICLVFYLGYEPENGRARDGHCALQSFW